MTAQGFPHREDQGGSLYRKQVLLAVNPYDVLHRCMTAKEVGEVYRLCC